MSSPLEALPLPRPDAESHVLALLLAGIPLTLLMDLAQDDPHSRELYASEPAS